MVSIAGAMAHVMGAAVPGGHSEMLAGNFGRGGSNPPEAPQLLDVRSTLTSRKFRRNSGRMAAIPLTTDAGASVAEDHAWTAPGCQGNECGHARSQWTAPQGAGQAPLVQCPCRRFMITPTSAATQSAAAASP